MIKHTDGPWTVCDGGRMVATAAEGADGWELCDVRDDVYGYQQNAALIAAAPDLLEALETIKEAFWLSCEDLPDEFNSRPEVVQATAAIAKARGQQ